MQDGYIKNLQKIQDVNNMLRRIHNILRAYVNASALAKTRFNENTKNKNFVAEQIDGYVNLHKEKEEVINELKIRICDIIQKYSENGDKILDFGCGTGRYLKELEKESRYNLFGLDIADQVIENYTRKNVKNVELFSTNILKDKSFVNEYANFFNIIYSVTTLEYLSPFDLNKIFERLNDLLVEHGVLILQFPIPKNIIERFNPGYFKHQPIDVEKKLKNNKFKILESVGVGTDIRIKKYNKNKSNIGELEYLIVAEKI